MTCAELEELVWLAIDDELTPAERQRVDAHAASCAACRRRIAEAHLVASGLRQLATPRAPEGFAATTLERLQERPGLRRLAPWRTLAAAAAVLVAAAIGWVAWHERGQADRSGSELELAAAPAAADAAPAVASRAVTDSSEEFEKRRAPGAPPFPAPTAPAPPARLEEPQEKDQEADRDADSATRPHSTESGDAVEAAKIPAAPASVAPPLPLDQAVRDAGSPKEALAELLLAAKATQSEGALRRLDDSKAKQDAGELAGFSADPEKKIVPTAHAVEPATVEFLVVPRDAAATRDWLRARGDVASDGGVAIVDVTPAELQSLLDALTKAKHPAEQLASPAWLERAAPAIAREQLTRGKPSGPRSNGARGAGPVGAKANKDGDKGGVGGAAKEGATVTGGLAGKAGAPKAEAEPAAKPVRVILWLAPPAAPVVPSGPTGERH